jgi:catechol-2,3-dioxygenase
MNPTPSLHHLALGAENVESLAAFYRDVVGLPETARRHYEDGSLRSIWLAVGDGVLMVEPAEQGRRDVPHHSSGLFLMAFKMSPDQRAIVEGQLKAESQTEHTRYFRDPEGNRFAISDFPLR